MPANYSYESNEAGFNELLRRPAIASAMVAVGTPALAEAARTAPKRTGAYAASFSIRPEFIPGGYRGELRAGAVISNEMPYARYVMDPNAIRSHMWTVAQRMGGGSD